MKRLLFALGLVAVPAMAAYAEDPPPPPRQCSVTISLLAAPDVQTIGCNGIGEQFAGQLADILTQVLQRKLDPQQVLAKLDDVPSVPDSGVARSLDPQHRQIVVQTLLGKEVQQIAIAASPVETDAGDYGKDIATALMMVGWQVDGNQISRKDIPALAQVRGVAIVVRDAAAPPAKAEQLKAALEAAQVEAPFHADPTLPSDKTMLWIGPRPRFNPLEAATKS